MIKRGFHVFVCTKRDRSSARSLQDGTWRHMGQLLVRRGSRMHVAAAWPIRKAENVIRAYKVHGVVIRVSDWLLTSLTNCEITSTFWLPSLTSQNFYISIVTFAGRSQIVSHKVTHLFIHHGVDLRSKKRTTDLRGPNDSDLHSYLITLSYFSREEW